MENILINLLKENPDSLIPFVAEYSNKYKGLLYALASEVFSVYKDFANNDEYFETEAQITYKRYATLVAAGFSRDQAMEILLDDTNRATRNISKNLDSLNSSIKKIATKM